MSFPEDVSICVKIYVIRLMFWESFDKRGSWLGSFPYDFAPLALRKKFVYLTTATEKVVANLDYHPMCLLPDTLSLVSLPFFGCMICTGRKKFHSPWILGLINR